MSAPPAKAGPVQAQIINLFNNQDCAAAARWMYSPTEAPSSCRGSEPAVEPGAQSNDAAGIQPLDDAFRCQLNYAANFGTPLNRLAFTTHGPSA
jgi:hypothetical protein